MMTEQRGKFITIEGQDGAGKSTNIDAISHELSEQGIDFIVTREPGGTPAGERIRELILQSNDQHFGSMTELLLIFAARAQHIETVIEPALSAGQWVLCDRFTDASYAYQGGGRGMPESVIAELERLVQGELRPDLTILLDLPVSTGEQRAGERGDEADRFEQQAREFKQRVRDSYLSIASGTPHRVKLVDASQPLEDVQAAVRSQLQDFINDQL